MCCQLLIIITTVRTYEIANIIGLLLWDFKSLRMKPILTFFTANHHLIRVLRFLADTNLLP
jgi:hypothetical protein